MAFLTPRPMSNSFGTSMGQNSEHIPQPVHLSSSTYLGCFKILTTISGFSREIPTTLEHVRSLILGCLAASTILGVRMQAEQSSVGNVLSS